MTARKFRADAAVAATEAQAGRIGNITSVEKGDDGEVVVTYDSDKLASPLQIRLLATNVDDYPGPCGFLLFTDCEDPPKQILQSMEEVQDHAAAASNFTVLQAASLLAKTLSKRLDVSQLSGSDADLESLDGDDEDDFGGFESDDDNNAQDHEGDDLDHLYALMDGQPATASSQRAAVLSESDQVILARIKRSLRKVRKAGCRVGILTGMLPHSHTNIVSMSTRVRKLRLSDEALGAWGLSDSDYIILLVQFRGGFPFMEQVMERPASSSEMKFRIAKCAKYKPTLAQAMSAFDERKMFDSENRHDEAGDTAPPLSRIFLSRSLDLYMNQYFVSLLKVRGEAGGDMSWDEANTRLLDRMGSGSSGPPNKRPRKSKGKSKDSGDHLTDDDNDKSVLLVSWQFAMRYLVDCTKYCLRCHRAIESGFGSIKPFVCSDPLCLFQYMQMGLGPSVEHEILLQPTVVDLLVSFCYVSTQPAVRSLLTESVKFAIREFPVGLSLKVPDMFHSEWKQRTPDTIPVYVDVSSATATLYDPSDWPEDLRPGRWFVLLPHSHLREGGVMLVEGESERFGKYHRPVPHKPANLDLNCSRGYTEENLIGLTFGTIISTNPTDGKVKFLVGGQTGQLKDPFEYKGPRLTNGGMHLALFNVDFDSLQDAGKARAIRFILNALPPIPAIKTHLDKNTNSSVRDMPNVPPAAATLLEWIVATNRSVILQIEDKDDAEAEEDVAAQPPQPQNQQPPARGSRRRKGGLPAASLPPPLPVPAPVATGQHNRPGGEMVPEMDNFLQFRFAQGSPDKEERFNAELERAVKDEKLEYPTIFAWHGSSIANWHSIIRTGLDYKDTVNGRAYGHGIYFSQDFYTSMGYGHVNASANWPSSQLNITMAIALSELVNIPNRFRSRHPHLVVQNLDWQQCRYLFVAKTPNHSHYSLGVPVVQSNANPNVNPGFINQDPAMPVRGPGSRVLQIPLAAIPSSRTIDQGQWRETAATVQASEESDEEDQDDKDFLADDTADENNVIVISSDDNDSSVVEISPPPRRRPAHLTDFRAGSLDLSALTHLQPPENAGGAAKHLTKQILALRRIQQSTPPHELGWFIDFDKMENMFQLVVELHSFDKGTLLGQDMVNAGVQSVVLELRFGESFPFSPPFVRVIRPRFLPFLNGGGGHVTAGGAMCMQLLTSDGWSPACSIESVLVQVRFAITSTEPPARLAQTRGYGKTDYGVYEAIEAYRRAANAHGWKVPEDLNRTANPDGSYL